MNLGFDAIYNDDTLNIHHNLHLLKKVNLLLQRKVLKRPTVFKYKDAIKYMIIDDCINSNVIPLVAPNWDHSPRSGANSVILQNSSPKLFKKVMKKAFEVVKSKPEQQQLIIIKSWNEWGEGNYLEPDLKFGREYLQVIKDLKNKI